jgi:hypothetical protein
MPRGSYPVGYCRTSVDTHWKSGQSGNPRGRPKGLKSVGQLLGEALARRVTIQKNGRPRTTRVQDVMIRGLVNDAARRDPRALKLLFAVMDRYGDGREREIDLTDLLPDDRDIIESYRKSIDARENDGKAAISDGQSSDSHEGSGDLPGPEMEDLDD